MPTKRSHTWQAVFKSFFYRCLSVANRFSRFSSVAMEMSAVGSAMLEWKGSLESP